MSGRRYGNGLWSNAGGGLTSGCSQRSGINQLDLLGHCLLLPVLKIGSTQNQLGNYVKLFQYAQRMVSANMICYKLRGFSSVMAVVLRRMLCIAGIQMGSYVVLQ